MALGLTTNELNMLVRLCTLSRSIALTTSPFPDDSNPRAVLEHELHALDIMLPEETKHAVLTAWAAVSGS